MKRTLIIFAALVVLSGAGYAVYAKLESDQKQQVEAALENEDPQVTTDEIEAKYIANMLAQNEDSNTVLKLAETTAEHQELKDLAQEYLDAVQDEERTLEQWQQEWSYEETQADENRLPNYVSIDEFEQMKAELATLSGDPFDKLFIEFLRIQTLSDNTQGYKVSSDTKHPELKAFADAAIDKRHQISTKQSEWPEQWGYVPPHDG